MIKKLLGFFGLAVLLSLIFFLVVPSPARAAESDQDESLTESAVTSPADSTEGQSTEESSSDSDTGEPDPAAQDHDVIPAGGTHPSEPESEVQLSMANPFGRTGTMGGRR